MKLRDIVSRAGLDLSTAQYALRNPDQLSRMPKAGSQGLHRTFTIDQAFRLAFAVRLVSAGIQLKVAARIVDCVDKHVTKITKERNEGSKYTSEPLLNRGDWTVVICDGDFLQLMRGGAVEVPQYEPRWLQISTWKTAMEVGEHFERYELNLTTLRKRLETA